MVDKAKNVVIRNQKKLKNLVTPEMRISLYQTAMNNSGRNFEGKKTTPKKMVDFTSKIYRVAIREIENIGELSLKQIENTIKPEPVKKATKNSNIKKLMGKIKRRKNGN